MDIEVRHRPERRRYELKADGAAAGHVGYTDEGGVRSIMHTWIEDEFEGQGLGSQFVVAILKDIRDSDLHVLPVCPFVPHVIAEHPEFVSLVPQDSRERFGLKDL